MSSHLPALFARGGFPPEVKTRMGSCVSSDPHLFPQPSSDLALGGSGHGRAAAPHPLGPPHSCFQGCIFWALDLVLQFPYL